jgi:uncharacterized surface anchored protein
MSFLFAVSLIFAATVTAYADYENGLPHEQEELPYGSLIVINSIGDGWFLSGAVFGLYRKGENLLIAELTVGDMGHTSEIFLPQGNYDLSTISPVTGYITIDWVSVIITAGEQQIVTIYSTPSVLIPETEFTLTVESDECNEDLIFDETSEIEITTEEETQTVEPAPEIITQPTPSIPVTIPNVTQPQQGSVEIITRAEQSGNAINGVVFDVHRVSDNAHITQIATDIYGFTSLSLSPNDYYLRNNSVPFGFIQENARIFFTVGETGAVAIDITVERDWNIPYADYGHITLPQTGEIPPYANYATGAAFMVFALICFAKFLKQKEVFS